MAYLTSRIPAPSVACNDILHIVKTTDTSQNPAGSSFKATVSQLFQCCVNDFYVKNIHGCNTGNLFVQPLDEGNIYFGLNTAEDGFTIDLLTETPNRARLGLNNNSPDYTIDFESWDDKTHLTWYDKVTASGFEAYRGFLHEGDSDTLVYIGAAVTPFAGLQCGQRGFNQTTGQGSQLGDPGDSFVFSSDRAKGLNIISSPSVFDSSNPQPDYIRFFAGNDPDFNNVLPTMFMCGRDGYPNKSLKGNVCINCSDPTEILDVNGNVTIRRGLSVSLSGQIGTDLYVNNNLDVTNDLSVGVDADISGALTVGSNQTLNGNLFMITSRKIGIGTVSPTEQIHCTSSARFEGVGTVGSAFDLRITSNGTLTTTASDIRLKKNISTIENALEKVLSLRGVNFTWKDDESLGNRLGFIAQEVKEIVPDMVFTNEKTEDKIMGVHSDMIGPVLVEAVKELNEKIKLKEYTPISVNDPYGEKGDQVFDDNFMYIKTGAGWKKFPLMDI
jgi:hypothetical protein